MSIPAGLIVSEAASRTSKATGDVNDYLADLAPRMAALRMIQIVMADMLLRRRVINAYYDRFTDDTDGEPFDFEFGDDFPEKIDIGALLDEYAFVVDEYSKVIAKLVENKANTQEPFKSIINLLDKRLNPLLDTYIVTPDDDDDDDDDDKTDSAAAAIEEFLALFSNQPTLRDAQRAYRRRRAANLALRRQKRKRRVSTFLYMAMAGLAATVGISPGPAPTQSKDRGTSTSASANASASAVQTTPIANVTGTPPQLFDVILPSTIFGTAAPLASAPDAPTVPLGSGMSLAASAAAPQSLATPFFAALPGGT